MYQLKVPAAIDAYQGKSYFQVGNLHRLQYFSVIQVKSLRQEKNIRFTRFQDNKTILHLGAERNAARVLTFSFVYYLGANTLL